VIQRAEKWPGDEGGCVAAGFGGRTNWDCRIGIGFMEHDHGVGSFDAKPLVGIGKIRLGDTDSTIRTLLVQDKLSFNEHRDPFCWQLDTPTCRLSFINAPGKRLVQILSSSQALQLQNTCLVGMELAEALAALHVKSFDDTVWSTGNVLDDFVKGSPFVEPDNLIYPSNANLLNAGTLWIKSLGLGLTFAQAKVGAITLRDIAYVPRIGHGPLEQHTLDAANDPVLLKTLLETTAKSAARAEYALRVYRTILALVLFSTGVILCWVFYTMANDYRSWLNATQVTGKIVALKPDGLFPDEVVVEYLLPNEQSVQVSIPCQYSTARAVGKEVELVYRESNPSLAMTRLQSRDNFSSLSMNWLIYTIPLFSLALLLLFPKFHRRW
jgi:hypothetical protein